jgi:hypothetical protein
MSVFLTHTYLIAPHRVVTDSELVENNPEHHGAMPLQGPVAAHYLNNTLFFRLLERIEPRAEVMPQGRQ